MIKSILVVLWDIFTHRAFSFMCEKTFLTRPFLTRSSQHSWEGGVMVPISQAMAMMTNSYCSLAMGQVMRGHSCWFWSFQCSSHKGPSRSTYPVPYSLLQPWKLKLREAKSLACLSYLGNQNLEVLPPSHGLIPLTHTPSSPLLSRI